MNSRLADWWRRRHLTAPRIKRLTFYERRSEVPADVARDSIAVVGTLERPKWAIFECPCGRGHQITLNLSASRRPSWRIEQTTTGPSLHPSVDAYEPHSCHYWIKQGRVEFVRTRVRTARRR